jgi:hypothetical protein
MPESDTPNADAVEAALADMTARHRTWLGPVDPELREPAIDRQAVAWAEFRIAWADLRTALAASPLAVWWRRQTEQGEQ